MTDGSLFNLNEIETGSEPDAAPEAATGASDAVATPASRDAAAPRSLYRKYRPQSFDSDELFGQEHVVNTLRNAIALDRIAHAYLFCGPRGTGKTTTARLLAKAVNCQDSDPKNRPCNTCDACVSINTGATTDVIEIDAASNRGIDDIRDLRERVKYAPSQLTTKFYIIDEAHQITGAAANAFLKTLEEPPAHTKFILATTDPEELLQTIISRCQRFDFRRIDLESMTACLTKVAAAESIAIEDDAKTAIARHATGSMRDALGLLDQVAVYRNQGDTEGTTVTADLVRNVLGVSKNERVEEIATALADKDAGAGLRAVAQAVEAGDDIRHLARQLLAYMRQLLLERAGGASELDDTGKALSQRFEMRDLAELTRLMGDIDFKVKHATISQLPLEIAIVEGALRDERPQHVASQPQATPTPQQDPGPPPQRDQPRPAQNRPSWTGKVRDTGRDSRPTSPRPSNGPAQQPSSPPQQRPAAPAPPERSAPSAVASNGVFEIEALIDGWANVKADVKAVNRRIEALLQQIDPVSINGTTVMLVSPYEFHRNRVNTDEVRHVIEDVISRRFGEKVSIMCVTKNELPSAQAPSNAAPSPSAPTAPAPEAPAVQESQRVDERPADEPASEITTEPPAAMDTGRQIEAAKNIFDAEDDIEEPQE